ncbi:hypothetical protein ACT7CY_14040 [Bacillus pacificus]
MGLLRDEVIDAILIGKGKVEDRKWLINEQSLLDFIAFKTMDFTTFTEMKRKVEKNRLLQEKLKEIKLLIQD